MTQYWLLSVS